MTTSVIKKYALAALCGAAIVGVGQSAQAATWDIVLVPLLHRLVPLTTALRTAKTTYKQSERRPRSR
jgi:predicted membrane protein